jgi:hypothetical protein
MKIRKQAFYVANRQKKSTALQVIMIRNYAHHYTFLSLLTTILSLASCNFLVFGCCFAVKLKTQKQLKLMLVSVGYITLLQLVYIIDKF